METNKQWFDDINSPNASGHLKQWARCGLPINAKRHHITEKMEVYILAKNFKIVKK
jgi:hypothetical protein